MLTPLSGNLGPLGRVAWGTVGATYLLGPFRFGTNAGAPLSSPYTESGAQGSLTLVQTSGQFSISAGALQLSSTASGWGGKSLVGAQLARSGGRVVMADVQPLAGSNYMWFGFNDDATPGDSGAAGIDAVRMDNGNLLSASVAGSILVVDNVTLGTAYKFAVVHRSTGVFLLISGGAWSIWSLYWVGVSGSGAGYPAFSSYDTACTIDNLRATDLPAPWTTDYGIATQALLGTRSAGDTFTHEGDCLIEYTCTTLPASGTIDVVFRKQDASNYWIARISTAGDLSLQEVVGGTTTQRASAAAVVSNGNRIVITAAGSTIRGFCNNSSKWTYTSATNFQTATAGSLSSLGTGGAVSSIVTWPRTLSGTALSTLNAV